MASGTVPRFSRRGGHECNGKSLRAFGSSLKCGRFKWLAIARSRRPCRTRRNLIYTQVQLDVTEQLFASESNNRSISFDQMRHESGASLIPFF